MTSALDGMQIYDKDKQPLKALFSIRLSLELGSNVTEDKLSHVEKQWRPMTSTLDGIRIDDKEEQ
jgi:hypothetical protein